MSNNPQIIHTRPEALPPQSSSAWPSGLLPCSSLTLRLIPSFPFSTSPSTALISRSFPFDHSLQSIPFIPRICTLKEHLPYHYCLSLSLSSSLPHSQKHGSHSNHRDIPRISTHQIPPRRKLAIKPPILVRILHASVGAKRAPDSRTRLPHRLRKVAAAQQVTLLVGGNLRLGGPGLKGVGDGGSKVGRAGCWDGPPPVGVFAIGALCG